MNNIELIEKETLTFVLLIALWISVIISLIFKSFRMSIMSKISGIDDDEKIGLNFAIIILIFLLIVFMMTYYFDYEMKETTTEFNYKLKDITTEKTNIVAADIINEISGSVVNGNEEQYYTVFKVLEDNSKKLFITPADITKIYDTLGLDIESPYMEVDTNGFGTVVEVRLYIPKDSIKENYDVN